MTRLFSILLFMVAAAPAFPGGQAPDLSSPSLRIAYPAFKKLYDTGNVLVVDTRDEASFDEGHIPGARSIPLGEIEARLPELRREKRPIVTYCS